MLKVWRVCSVTCNNLNNLDVSSFNTQNVESMSNMFTSCHGLKDIKGIEKFNTGKVKNMRGMFSTCTKLSNLNHLSKVVTKNVTDISDMFAGCLVLNNIKIKNSSTRPQKLNFCSVTK